MIRRSVHSSSGTMVLPRRARPTMPKPVGSTWWRWLVLGLVVGFAFFYLAAGVLAVLFAAAAIAYLLDKPVTWLARRGMSREVAFLLLAFLGLVVTVVAVLIVVPAVVGQVHDLAVNLKPYLQNVVVRLTPWKAEAEARLGVAIPVDLPGLAEAAPEYLRTLAANADARNTIRDVLTRVAGGGMQVVLTVLTLALLPVFTFYICRDWPWILSFSDEMLPERHRPFLRRMAIEIDARIGAFVKGQLILCIVIGLLYSVGLWICRIDLPITVGLTGGLLFLIPFLGPAIGLGMAVVLALLKFGLDWHVLGVLATFAAVQALEGSVLTPMLVGDRVGLHPMVVMVAVVVFGDLLGMWGLVLAIPITAVLSVFAGALLAWYRESQFYRG